jgi:hypothetical protein
MLHLTNEMRQFEMKLNRLKQDNASWNRIKRIQSASISHDLLLYIIMYGWTLHLVGLALPSHQGGRQRLARRRFGLRRARAQAEC